MINLKWEFEGKTLDFNSNSFFKIKSVEGLDQPTAEFAVSNSPYRYGSKVQRAAIQPRIITINLIINKNAELVRESLYEVFKAGEKGTLFLKNSKREGKISCNFQEMVTTRDTLPVTAQIFLYAENPYFVGIEEIIQEMTNVSKAFEFKLEIPMNGMSFGEINTIDEDVITNDSDIEAGSEIEIIMLGTVVNPTIHNLTTNEYIGVTGTFETSDHIIINTNVGEKSIHLNENTNLISKLSSGSKWIKLKRGANTIKATASTGTENMKVSFVFNNKYGAM